MKATPLEVATDGLVFRTVIVLVPPVEISEEAILAFSCEVLTYAVGRSEPLHRTLDPLLKFEPFTTRVKPSLPAAIPVGEMEDIAGRGVGVVDGGEDEEELPPQPVLKKTSIVMMAEIGNGRNRAGRIVCFSGLPKIAM